MAYAADTQDEMFLSPYSDQERVDPQDEVDHIVERVSSSADLNPIVSKFLQDQGQRDVFFEAFARQANLIKSRCQAFEDCHVTVYDKVLLILTDNGNKFDDVAAQRYFCEEFLGISKDGDPDEARKILDQSVVLKAILARAAKPHGKYGEKNSSETKFGDRGQQEQACDGSMTGRKRIDKVDIVARLSGMYKLAKSRFESVDKEDYNEKLNAARFLRDTAENTIMYFREQTRADSGLISPELVAEVEQTFRLVQASVVSLSGGRKRKFERYGDNVPLLGRRNARNSSVSGSGRGGGNSRSDKIRHRARQVPRPGADERVGHHPRQRSFGYTRPVDSYQPATGSQSGGYEGGSTSHAHPHEQIQYYHEEPARGAGPATQADSYGPYDASQQEHGYGYRYEERRDDGRDYDRDYDRDYKYTHEPHRPRIGGGGGGSVHGR